MQHSLSWLKQATELCGEKAANLQTTLIHLQWQRKHVEQRLMTRRAAHDVGNGDTEATAAGDDTTGEGVTATDTAVTKGSRGCPATAQSSNSRKRKGAIESSMSSPPMPGSTKRSAPRATAAAEPEGLEVLQLIAKGQALSSAVVVVEGVLHKMEEQARTRTVSW